MSFKSKYIIIDVESLDLPVIFGEFMKHTDMARAINPRGEVLGAGFVHIDEKGKYVCSGESISLKVKSRGQVDSDYLNKYLGNEET